MKKSNKKDAIVNTAEALFYRNGFHSVGVKRILEQADVATMTMYYHFKSKEDLIVEVLLQREKQYFLLLDSIIVKEKGLKAYVSSIIEAHLKWVEEEGNNGCLFLRAKQEYEDINERISSLSKEHKEKLLNKIKNDLSSYKDSEAISVQLSILLEGITSMVQILDLKEVRHSANHLAENIIVTE